jgi:hypothetical protein
MGYDYLAISDGHPVNLLTTVYNTSLAKAPEWNIFPDEVTVWQPELTAYKAAVEALKNPASRSASTV